MGKAYSPKTYSPQRATIPSRTSTPALETRESLVATPPLNTAAHARFGPSFSSGFPQPVVSANAPSSTIQRKRTNPEADAEGFESVKTMILNDKKIDTKTTPIETQKSIALEQLTGNYATHLKDGIGKWAILTNAISTYKENSTKNNFIKENISKREGYDAKFSANYASMAKDSDEKQQAEGYKHAVNTSGFDTDIGDADLPEEAMEDTVDELSPADGSKIAAQAAVRGLSTTSPEYMNKFDVAKGKIRAGANFAWEIDADSGDKVWRDYATKAGKGINNSEILWQQHKLAAQSEYGGDEDKVKEAQKRIQMIERNHITNYPTLETLFMAQNDGETWSKGANVWKPGTEEFNAVLGTDNVKGSVFFLKDHLDEIQKTIEEIELVSVSGGNKNVQIKLKDIDR